MRQPVRLARSLGFAGFAAFQLVVGGTVLAALLHPPFIALMIYGFATGRLMPDPSDLTAMLYFGLFGLTLAAGYLPPRRWA
jgi:hypothetical protein